MTRSKISKTAVCLVAALVAACNNGSSATSSSLPPVSATSAEATVALPSPASATFTTAIGVNEGNQIAGFTVGPAGVRAASWTMTGGAASAPVEHLPVDGNTVAAAFGIGSVGLVVGESAKGTTTVAVAWSNGAATPTELSLTGFAPPAAAFASSGDRIVGQATLQGRAVGVIWTTPAAAPLELGTIDSDGTSRAYAISAGGLVVGEASDKGAVRAAVWEIDETGDVVDGPDPLDPLPGDVKSVAFGVDGVVIVGESEAADGSVRAVRWTRSPGGNISPPLLIQGRSASGVSGQTVVGHTGTQAALWDLANLGAPTLLASAPSQALGVNGLGTIVGFQGTSAFAITASTGTPTPATGLELTVSPESPSPSGQSITLTATGSGSTTDGLATPAATYQYRFFVNDGTGWTMVQDYGVGSTYSTTLPDGSYQFAAWVKTTASVTADVYGNAISHTVGVSTPTPATDLTLVANPVSPSPTGDSVTFTATGSGSTTGGSPTAPEDYDYRFFLNTGSGWTQVQDYGNGATLTLTNPTAGTYLVAAWVRTTDNVTADVYGEAITHVVGVNTPTAATGLTLVASPESPSAAGQIVTFTATGSGSLTGGVASPASAYQYQFFVNDGTGWISVQGYSTDNTLELDAPAGTYQVAAWVRTTPSVTADVYGNPVTHVIGLNTPTPATGLTLLANPSPSAPGALVTLTATGSGSLTNGLPSPAAAYQYRFFVNDGTGWIMMQDYGVGSTFAFTPSAGVYQVAAWVKTTNNVIADVYGDAVLHLVQ